MNKHLFAVLAVGVLTASSSSAADLGAAPVDKAPIISPWNWTGFYVGANVGESWGRASTNASVTRFTSETIQDLGGVFHPPSVSTTSAGNTLAKLNGWEAGGQAGYNWQIEHWVFGMEGDIQALGQRGNATFCSLPGCPAETNTPFDSFFETGNFKQPWFATLRGRLGYSWDMPGILLGPVMPYATGGLTVAKIDYSYTSGVAEPAGTGLFATAGDSPIGNSRSSTTRGGFVVGGGAEASIGRGNWTVKIEYLYMDFGHVSGVASGPPITSRIGTGLVQVTTTNSTQATATTHVTDQIVRVGLNYRFAM